MVDQIDRAEMASSYGFALAFMQSNPELSKLFNQAVKQTWTPDKFVAELRGTKWFEKHSANVRNAILQETADPATYKASVDQMYSTVRNAWGSMFGMDVANNKQLRSWAETAHRMGWSEAELVDRMTKGIDYQKLLKRKNLGGSAAETEGQLDMLIQNYGVGLGKDWKARQVKKLMSGDATIEGVQQQVRELSARTYKAFADRIQGGETVADVVEPYRQKMADLLELNPSEVGVMDKTIQKALNQRGPDGKAAAMDMADFADEVRRDKRWQFTDNAKEETASVTASLLQSFGIMSGA